MDKHRQRQTKTDKDGQRRTKTDKKDGQTKTKTDKGGQRKWTNTDKTDNIFHKFSQERVGLSAEQMLADALHLKLV
jgi:hypothetical protein